MIRVGWKQTYFENMQLNQRQRELAAEKLADLGNIAVGSLVFGFVIQSNLLNSYSLLLGMITALLAYSLTLSLTR